MTINGTSQISCGGSRKIQKTKTPPRVRYCSDTAQFSAVVQKILLGTGIIVMLPRDTAELNEILKIREKMRDQNVILILGDTGIDLVGRGVKLYPRYITYMKTDYTDISQVLEKMTAKIAGRHLHEAVGKQSYKQFSKGGQNT